MPRVTIILTDTPAGGVAVWSDHVPAAGAPASRAQTAAMDIVNRTCREYGLPNPFVTVSRDNMIHDGVDIDAVHSTRDRVINLPEFGGSALHRVGE